MAEVGEALKAAEHDSGGAVAPRLLGVGWPPPVAEALCSLWARRAGRSRKRRVGSEGFRRLKSDPRARSVPAYGIFNLFIINR